MTDEQKQLVIDNMKLVAYIIRRHIFLGKDEFEDLLQEGLLYLCKAAISYNKDIGNFSTYAYTYVLGGLKRYKREKGVAFHGLKLKRKDKDNIFKIHSTMERLNTDNINEISKEISITKQEIQRLMITVSSIDAPIKNKDGDEELTLSSVLAYDKDDYDEVISNDNVELILNKFKNKFKPIEYDMIEDIVYSYLIGGEQVRQRELALRYGISQAYISRLLKRLKKEAEEIIEEIRKEE